MTEPVIVGATKMLVSIISFSACNVGNSAGHMLGFVSAEMEEGGVGSDFSPETWAGFLEYFRPRGQCGFFARWQDTFPKVDSRVRRRLLSVEGLLTSVQRFPLQSCWAGINPGVTDCQPTLLQTLPPSTRNCQGGFLLTGEHNFTFSEVRDKRTRQLEMQSLLPSEQNFTKHQ